MSRTEWLQTDPVFDREQVIMTDDMKLTAENEFLQPKWILPRLNITLSNWSKKCRRLNGNVPI